MANYTSLPEVSSPKKEPMKESFDTLCTELLNRLKEVLNADERDETSKLEILGDFIELFASTIKSVPNGGQNNEEKIVLASGGSNKEEQDEEDDENDADFAAKIFDDPIDFQNGQVYQKIIEIKTLRVNENRLAREEKELEKERQKRERRQSKRNQNY